MRSVPHRELQVVELQQVTADGMGFRGRPEPESVGKTERILR